MLSFLVWIGLFFNQHPLYMSNTIIKYEESKKALSVRVQIFETDIQEVLQITHGIDIVSDAKNPNIQKYIDEYVWDNLKIKIDGKSRKDFTFLKKSKNYDALIFEYEIKSVPTKPKKLEVEATYLMELFAEQTNIVELIVGSTKRTFPLKEFNIKAEINP